MVAMAKIVCSTSLFPACNSLRDFLWLNAKR